MTEIIKCECGYVLGEAMSSLPLKPGCSIYVAPGVVSKGYEVLCPACSKLTAITKMISVKCSDCGHENIYLDSGFTQWMCAVCGNRHNYPPAVSQPKAIDSIAHAQCAIAEVCDEIKNLLLSKNRKYGNSAIEPERVFSRADPIEQINVRLDDKLSRIKSRQDDDDEDPEFDLIGYLILKRVAIKLRKGQAK